MPIIVLILLGCVIMIYVDARRLGTGIPRTESIYDTGFGYFPPGGWAFIVLVLGPIGSLLYVLFTYSRVGVVVLIIQLLMFLLIYVLSL